MAYFSNTGPNTQVFPNAPGAMPGVPMGAGVGSTMPATVGAPGRSAMWTGGGANPAFGGPPQGMPPQAVARGLLQGAPQGPPPGMPLGLTPEILAQIQARMAANQFRSGPENSLLPTGVGNSPFARMMPGDY